MEFSKTIRPVGHNYQPKRIIESMEEKLKKLLESTYDMGDVNVNWVVPYREGIEDCIKVIRGEEIK